MFADSELTDRASCKIIQFDLSKQMTRQRSVSIYTDGSLQTVRAGTLVGPDSGIFGGQVYTFGYDHIQTDSCEVETIEFKYPQFYSGSTSVSPLALAYVQSITESDSCLPFDDTYDDWADADYYQEDGTLESGISSTSVDVVAHNQYALDNPYK